MTVRKLNVKIFENMVQFDPPSGLMVRPSQYLDEDACVKIPKDNPRVLLVSVKAFAQLVQQLKEGS